MTSRSYFGKMNSTLGSVVPLAMFHIFPNCRSSGRWLWMSRCSLLAVRGFTIVNKLRTWRSSISRSILSHSHISEYNHIQIKIKSNFRGFLIRCTFSPSLNRQRMLLYDVMLQVFDYKLACEIVMIPDSTDPFTSPCYRITPKQVTDTRLCTFSA